MLEAAVVAAALATIPLTVVQERGASGPLVVACDWMVWSVFVVEYLALAFLGRNRRDYVRRNRLNLAIIVLSFPLLPVLLDLVRLARLGRLFRVLRLSGVSVRGLGALRTVLGRRGLAYMSAVTALLILAGAALLTVVEPSTVENSLWGGVWWAIITATAVGYGDIAPHTTLGRGVAIALILSGVGLFSTLAASIAAYFVEQEEGERLRSIEQRLDRTEALLRQLVEATSRKTGPDRGSNGEVE